MSFTLRNRTILNLFKRISLDKSTVKVTNACYSKNILCPISNPTSVSKTNLEIVRYKHSNKKQKQESDSEEEDNEDDFENQIVDKQTRLITAKVNSLRADLILKAGLGIARNKIEAMFYESRIRVNGKKILKKSVMLSVGDEIDIVKGASSSNPDFLTVSRVEILSATERSEGLSVKLRRNKSLTIENYNAENSWK